MTDVVVVGGTSGIATADIDHYLSETTNRVAVPDKARTKREDVAYEGYLTVGLVPALQRRGGTRSSYVPGSTLRANLTEF